MKFLNMDTKNLLNPLLLTFFIISISCISNQKKFADKENENSYDSTISELHFKDITINIITFSKEGELSPEEDLAGSPILFDQKVEFVQNGQIKKVNLPIPFGERKLLDGGNVNIKEATINYAKIVKGTKGELINLFCLPSCGTCAFFEGFYTLKGDLLGYKFGKANEIISSSNNLESVFKEYGIVASSTFDYSKKSPDFVSIDLSENQIYYLSTTDSDSPGESKGCFEDKVYSLPFTSETEGDFSGYLEDNKGCLESIPNVGEEGGYFLISNKLGNFKIIVVTVEGDFITKFLVTIKDYKVISMINVYKDWFDEPGSPTTTTNTTYKINTDYTVDVKEDVYSVKKGTYDKDKLISNEKKSYQIREDGQIIDLQTNKTVEIGE